MSLSRKQPAPDSSDEADGDISLGGKKDTIVKSLLFAEWLGELDRRLLALVAAKYSIINTQ